MGVYFPGTGFTLGDHFGVERTDGTHGGVDFPANANTPIPVAGDGVVVGRGYHASNAYGYAAIVRHVAPDTGNVLFTLYAHMPHTLYTPAPGTYVRKGEVIGIVGNTGNSSGPHLHLELFSYAEEARVPWSVEDPWTGGKLGLRIDPPLPPRVNPATESNWGGLDVFDGTTPIITPPWAICIVHGTCAMAAGQ
jgi:murein DD-endopeptidase MepM/ murein hydrolase activator NlpD